MTIRPVPLGTSVGRIPVVDVSPVAEAGRFPAKAVVGEAVPVRATVFREGHDAVAATAVLTDPTGVDRASARMVDIAPGLDRFEARLVPTGTGDWTFRVEGWSDPYGTWVHDADDQGRGRRRRRADARRGRSAARAGGGAHGCRRDVEGRARVLKDAVMGLRDVRDTPQARLGAGLSGKVHAALADTRCATR